MAERTIVLRFVDAESGKLLGEHPAPESQVPESFEVATTLDIGQVRFEVVHAEPSTRAAAATQGFMTLRLRRVDIRMVDPKELLCSLPSIADQLPEMAAARSGPVLRLHEDDWRQIELLSPEAAELGATDLAAIADIHRGERVGSGFRRLHVRRLREPLAGANLGQHELGELLSLQTGTHVAGIVFQNQEGRVAGGFALQVAGGIHVYGRAGSGVLKEIGVIRSAGHPTPAEKLELASWIADRRLLLVDWCRVRTAGQVADIQALLGDLWPQAGESPGRIFLGLPRESRP